jgi:flap endonuclease-1
MGVDISDLVEGRRISLSEMSGKIIAIDAFNALYQFLSIIRQPDGTPLKNRDGEVTSHMSGLFYRCINLLEVGIKPVFVFDGKPPELKRETILARSAARMEAEVAWKEALAEGDVRRAWSKATRASRLTGMMIEDSRTLLEHLGIPWVQAPSEGEAQASAMVSMGVAHAAASQDFDALLFGCPRLVRNLAISGKRRLPRTNKFVNVDPEEVLLDKVLGSIGVSRPQLIDMGIMMGTDFNRGIKGIGPKKALAIVKNHNNIEGAVKAGKIPAIDLLEELRGIFLNPPIEEKIELSWGKPKRPEILGLMCDRNSFSVDRINSALDRIPSVAAPSVSTSLDKWL